MAFLNISFLFAFILGANQSLLKTNEQHLHAVKMQRVYVQIFVLINECL